MEDSERNSLLNNFRLWFPRWHYRQLLEEMNRREAEERFPFETKLVSDLDSLIESEGLNLSRLEELRKEYIRVASLFAEYQIELSEKRIKEGREKNLPEEELVFNTYADSLVKISSEANRIVEPFYHKMIKLGYSPLKLQE